MKNKSNDYDNEAAGKPEASECNGSVSSGRRNDLFGEMCIVWLAINLIEVSPHRVRRAMKKQVDDVVVAIRKFGFRAPILVKRTGPGNTYQVIDGHIRLEAARRPRT